MSIHETGGQAADQPASTDHSDTIETRANGDIPIPSADPPNREARDTGGGGGGRPTVPGSLSVDTKTGEKLNQAKEGVEAIARRAEQAYEKAAAQWEEKLKVALKK